MIAMLSVSVRSKVCKIFRHLGFFRKLNPTYSLSADLKLILFNNEINFSIVEFLPPEPR